MRSAVAKACTALGVTSIVEDLDREVRAEGDEALGAGRGAAARILFHRLCSLRDSPAPAVVLPIRDNFWALVGRRVRMLSLPDSPTVDQGCPPGVEGFP